MNIVIVLLLIDKIILTIIYSSFNDSINLTKKLKIQIYTYFLNEKTSTVLHNESEAFSRFEYRTAILFYKI